MSERRILPFSASHPQKPERSLGRIARDLVTRRLSPEVVDPAGRLVDKIQEMLIDAYGLQGMSLRKPSEFLWPKKTSEAAEHRRSVRGEEDSFYISDGEQLQYPAVFTQSRDIIPISVGAALNTKSALLKRGLLPFEALNPVIHLGKGLTKRLQNASLPDLLAPDRLSDLELAVEEVGHFLYEQTQYKLHKKLPGRIMQEGIAYLNLYLVFKKVAEEVTGKNVFDPTNEQAKAVVEALREKILRPLKRLKNWDEKSSTDPVMDWWLTNQYAKSSLIVGGFVIHTFENDQAGIDMKEELAKFYRLTGPQKARYLRDLYAKHVEAGDNRYKWNLDEVESRIELDLEFREEVIIRNFEEKLKELKERGGSKELPEGSK